MKKNNKTKKNKNTTREKYGVLIAVHEATGYSYSLVRQVSRGAKRNKNIERAIAAMKKLPSQNLKQYRKPQSKKAA